MIGISNKSNKIALVTGASRGIGKAIALRLSQENYVVIINYNNSEDSALALKNEIESNGKKADAFLCDVSDFESSEKLIEDIIDKYGRIDVVVNNAGITRDNLLVRMTEHDFDTVINTNLKGTFNIIRHVSQHMIFQRSGKIINISSVAGITGNGGQANYCSSKAGIIGLTKSVAREFATRNITVNAVAPGIIETDLTADLTDEVKKDIVKNIPLKRIGKVEDIAEMVSFLASEKSNYITGQVFCIDGGMTI